MRKAKLLLALFVASSLFLLSACGAQDSQEQGASEEEVVDNRSPEEILFDTFEGVQFTEFKLNDEHPPRRDMEKPKLEVFYLPKAEDAVVRNFSVSVEPCGYLCEKIKDSDAWDGFVFDEDTTQDIGVTTISGVDVYYVMNTITFNGEPMTDFVAAYQHDDYYVRTMLQEGYEIDGDTIDPDQAKTIAFLAIQEVIDGTK